MNMYAYLIYMFRLLIDGIIDVPMWQEQDLVA